MSSDDAQGLFGALADHAVWRWLSSEPPRTVEDMARYIDGTLAERDRGLRFPWTVRRLGAGDDPDRHGDAHRSVVVGMTSFGDIEPQHSRIEIGWTAYGVAWQRTRVNTATKVLLLDHVFDELGYERVSFKTDGCNEPSKRAIERLGATYEGVLRSHRVRPDGSRRDTVYYSILRAEWPELRRALVRRGTPGGSLR